MKRSKFLQVCLIFALILSSLGSVYQPINTAKAQENTSPEVKIQEAPSDDQVLALPMPEIQKPVVTKPEILEPETEDLSAIKEDLEEEALLEAGPDDYIQPNEIKSITDKLNVHVDSSNGSFGYNYPIVVPQGRNGLQPDLQLSYNSQNTTDNNLFGYGWDINIPYIERLNKTGIDKLYTDNYFSSSLSGELVAVTLSDGLHGQYAARVDNGDFLKYEFASSTDTWKVTDKEGKIYTFGSNYNSRQYNTNNSSKLFKWMLEEVRDTNDNFIRYEYYKDDGQIYPKRIIYTGNGARDEQTVNLDDRHAMDADGNTLLLYHMNGVASSTTKKDNAQGNSQYDLLEVGVPASAEGSNNRVDEVYSFNGVNQYLQIPDHYPQIVNGPTTFEFWVKADPQSNFQTILSVLANYTPGGNIRLSINNQGKLDCYLSWNNTSYYNNLATIGNTNIADGEWHYVAMVLRNNPRATVDFYVDGALDVTNEHTSRAYEFDTFSYGWRVGAGIDRDNINAIPSPLRGSIDEFRISSVARSAQSIADYYNNIEPIIESNIIETNDGIFEVEFLRDDRNDDIVTYQGGGANVKNNYRIDEIDIKINNQLEKKYNLNYIAGSNNTRSLLDNVVESALDKTTSQMVAMPEDNFDYQETTRTWTETGYNIPVDCAAPAAISDLNGDSLPDLVCFFHNNDQYEDYPLLYLNNGDRTWQNIPNPNVPITSQLTTLSKMFQIADFNGDGLNDFISNYSDYNGVYLNDGNLGWIKASGYGGVSNDDIYRSMYIDVNGDQRADKIYTPSRDTFKRVYINNGSTFVENINYKMDFWIASTPVPALPIDLNNDGFVDFIYSEPSDMAYINNGDGTGWHADLSYTVSIPLYITYGTQRILLAKLVDVNGDGLNDIVKRDYWHVFDGIYLNNGDGTWTSDNNFYTPPMRFPEYGYFGESISGIDIDGDSLLDWVDENFRAVYLSDLPQTVDMVNKVSTRNGSQIDINYGASAQETDINGDLLNPELPFVVQTVKQITVDDGMGNESVVDYKYSGGQFYYAGPHDKKFSGFAQVEKTIDDTKTVTYYHQGNDSNSGQGEYQDSYYKIGKPYRQETYDNNTDELLNQTIYKWEETDLGYDNSFVYNTLKSTTDFTNTTKSTAIEYQYSTSTGNLLVENNLGEVVVNTGTGAITNQLTGDEKDTDYDYAQNITEHILAAPMTKVISDSTDSKQQNLYYDNLELGEVEKVNLTKEDYIEQDVEVNRNFNDLGLVTEEISPKNATTTIAYDSNNMYPASSTDPLNNVTYTEYNLLNGQVATSTAPNGLQTINTFDAFGRLAKVQISDPNNPNTLITKQEIIYQDASFPNYKETKDYFEINSYVTSREYYDGLYRAIQKKSQMPTSGEYSTVDISYDSQGRMDRQSLPYVTSSIDYSTPNLSQPAKTYTYDALGRVLTEITPTGTTAYEYNGFTTKITDANGNFKELTKDAYGNLIEVKEYNGSNVYTTAYEYTLTNKLKKIIDSAGNIRNFSYDALDNLEWQDMVHKTSVTNPAKIQYTYDKNGNVLTETSFKNDAISYTYDDLNRPLTEKLSGVTKISYTYDQNGDIGQLTFADYGSGNSKAYDYDILGRLKTATTTIANEVFVMNYDYDLNGNLKEIIYPDNKVVSYGFNATGQVDEVSLDQGQGANVLAYNIEYNQNGQMTHVERANGVNTDYTYDPAESFRLTDMVSTVATSTLQSIAYTYDNIGNITNITDDSDTALAKSVNYYYDGLYRLATSTVSYTTHSGDNYTQTFAYDSIGNMTSNSDLGTMNYANGQPHQLSSYGSRNFQYDAAGNMTRNGGINKFMWDWRNRLSTSNDIASNNNTYYQYDHNNQRFIKWTEDYIYIPPDIEDGLSSGGRMQVNTLLGGEELDGVGHWEWQRITQDKYVDKYFEKDIVSDTKSHIYLGSTKLATVNDNDSPYFILGDHLNSSSILVSNVGTVAQLSDYRSFGKIKYDNKLIDLKNDHRFTGKEVDEENSLQYFGARYMDNQIARFTSVDPLLLKLNRNEIYNKLYKNQYSMNDEFNNLLISLRAGKDNNSLEENDLKNLSFYYFLSEPQQLNSYVYASNNPLVYIDTNGEVKWRQVTSGFNHSVIYGGAKTTALLLSIIAAPETAGATAIASPYLLASAGVDVAQGVNEIVAGFKDEDFEYKSMESAIIEEFTPIESINKIKEIGGSYNQMINVLKQDLFGIIGDTIDNILKFKKNK